MQIKFSVNYEYVPSAPKNKQFQATISAFIPKEPKSIFIQKHYEGKIGDKLVRGGSFEILNNFYKENLVKFCVKFSAGSSEEIKKNVENAIESYKQQVLTNMEIMKKIKETEKEIIINLPDPIKFSVEYHYYPLCNENNRFHAEVSAHLPKAQSKEYISPFYFGKIGEREINYDSGVNEENSIRISVNFHAESLETLISKVKSAIKNYEQQVIKNTKKVKEFTENREIIIDLPDQIH